MKRILSTALVAFMLISPSFALDGKTLGHLISIPVIEGTGIYSSVRLLQTGTANGTAAAITNFSLIGINAGIGAYTLFGKPADYEKWRMAHRVAGMFTSAAAIWLAISAGVNDDVARLDKGVAAGYSVLAVVPVVLFSF